ncbi:hypothetical protein [Cellvibrio zantedeschiae]|uniref:hypothetical protein n=1 Tax=Cellvibrio zantedeschiae TaxID=1237077 RepID=UPI001671B0F9|nr:hypothetical protein [Cellvibrio zantedeschiae]
MERSPAENSIRNYAANLACISAFYAGFAFFNHLFLYDIAILSVLSLWLFKKQSLTGAILAFMFGIVAVLFAFQQPTFAGGWHLALAFWWVWSGGASIYFVLKLKRTSNESKAKIL